jgi:aminomethyltransferase
MGDTSVLSELRTTPLHSAELDEGARLVQFGEWSMPLAYSSILEEHRQVRQHAGLFDVSHMGKLMVRGPGALASVQRLVTCSLSRLVPGAGRYTVMLTPDGGIRDDLIVYRQNDGVLLIVNAGNTRADKQWIEENLRQDAWLEDLTTSSCLLALQGPEAEAVLSRLTPCKLSTMRPFTFASARVASYETTVMRTGYTGEDGFEILVGNEDSVALWHALLVSSPPVPVRPCGLGARDLLRLEAALLLHGTDMDAGTNPFEAGLGWIVELDGADFVGREALLRAKQKGLRRVLVGLSALKGAIPRTGDRICVGGQAAGSVTSGSYSPVLRCPIALGYLPPEFGQVGQEVKFVVRGRSVPGRVVRRPFYRRGVTPLPYQRDHTE